MITSDFKMDVIKGVMARVISKSDERRARGRFEITSTFTLWIVRHEVQLYYLIVFITNFGIKNVYFYFPRLHRPQHLRNIELRGWGIRDLTLDANKLEQMLKYRKASFPKSVSTTFVAHCSLIIYESLVRSQSILHSIKFILQRC